MRTPLTTLCYVEQDGKYLMLHRTKRQGDINHDKWLGVGGHFEDGESPDECMCREVKEETGLTVTSWRARGLVTFIGGGICEYMHLFTVDGFTGDIIECDEGDLAWVDKREVAALPAWEGDRIFLGLLAEEEPYFLLKLIYDEQDHLMSANLNGTPLPLDEKERMKKE